MATFEKRGEKYRAIIRLKGVYESATFTKKTEAKAWALAREAEIRATSEGRVPDKLFSEVLEKYRDEVLAHKEGNKWDMLRVKSFLADSIASVRLPAFDSVTVVEWRDRRLAVVGPSTVIREASLLSTICNKAVKEWRLMRKNPVHGVEMPEPPPHRDRLITKEEQEKILYCLDYDEGSDLKMVKQRIGAAFLFAIETAMRAGEILALEQRDLFLDRKFVKVRGEAVGGGKTRAARRDVPLSDEAIRILKQLPVREDGKVFGVAPGSLDAMFRKATTRAAIEDATFHDTRHTACTKLARKLPLLALARMIGHKDLNMLQIYYNETAEELAKLL